MPSGVTSFTYNRDQIIRRAARLVNAIATGEIPTAALTTDFSEALNAMVKEWQASGIHVWTQSEATLFLQTNVTSYTIGASGNAHCTASFNSFTIATAAVFGNTTVVLNSVANISANDNIGFVLDNGLLQWCTVSSTNIGASSVTFSPALTDSSQVGNAVYDYTANIARPMRVLSGRRYNFVNNLITPIDPPLSRQDYHWLTSLTNTGPITQWFYDPQIPNGIMNVWPSPSDVTAALQFTYMRP